MVVLILETKDQNNNKVFGAQIENLTIPCIYKSKFTLLRRVAQLKTKGIYSNCIKL